jgi:hypothetical protein
MRAAMTCLLLLVPAGLVSGRDTDDWIDFSPKGGKFTIKMPAKPKDVSQEIDSPGGGKLKIRIYAAEEENAGAYLVSYADFPEDLVDADDLPGQYDRIQGGIVKSAKGKVLTSKNVKVLKKYPGREVTYTVPALKGTGKVRMFFVEARLYQIMALGTEEFMGREDVGFYFDSFKITAK